LCDNKYMEFKIEDLVVHNRDGLSKIISSTKIGENEYFLIRALAENSSTIYVPVAKADTIIRPVMNADQADELLKKAKQIKKEFNPSTKQRRDLFKKKLNSGNVDDMLYLFRQKLLYEEDPEGIKLGQSDSDMLEFASDFLLREFELSYNVAKDKILDFVVARIKKL